MNCCVLVPLPTLQHCPSSTCVPTHYYSPLYRGNLTASPEQQDTHLKSRANLEMILPMRPPMPRQSQPAAVWLCCGGCDLQMTQGVRRWGHPRHPKPAPQPGSSQPLSTARGHCQPAVHLPKVLSQQGHQPCCLLTETFCCSYIFSSLIFYHIHFLVCSLRPWPTMYHNDSARSSPSCLTPCLPLCLVTPSRRESTA